MSVPSVLLLSDLKLVANRYWLLNLQLRRYCLQYLALRSLCVIRFENGNEYEGVQFGRTSRVDHTERET